MCDTLRLVDANGIVDQSDGEHVASICGGFRSRAEVSANFDALSRSGCYQRFFRVTLKNMDPNCPLGQDPFEVEGGAFQRASYLVGVE